MLDIISPKGLQACPTLFMQGTELGGCGGGLINATKPKFICQLMRTFFGLALVTFATHNKKCRLLAIGELS